MPFEKGNQLRANSMRWQTAIDNALNKRTASRKDKLNALDVLAEKLLERADEGDMTALKELGDRIDGKPSQAINLDASLNHSGSIERIERIIVDK